ncbi:MAG: DUF2029 domain-containing protein [Deltaproteobacteria bacterium]|nr:DUF2029 domain-containing protein [Deltaproteobacteria bacterium]
MTRRTQILLGAAAVAVILHLVIVISVAKQPLRVNAFPEQRSLIWKYHHDTIHRAGPGSDFFAVYHAAVKQARGESPYDNKESPRVTPEFYPFRYLPIVGQTLGRGATMFDGRTAYVIWCVLLELLLAGTLLVLWKIEASRRWKLGLSAALLFSSPYFLEVHIGQFTFATCALLAIGLALLDRSEKSFSAGGTAAYAAAVLLKVFPLAAGAALIRRRKGFYAAAVAGGLVLITAVPYFLSYPDEWKAFAKVNFGDTGTEGFHGGNYGFLYMVFLAMKGIAGPAAVKGFLIFARNWQLVVLGITAILVLWKKPTILTGGLTLALAHMISYKHVWEHHASGAVVLGVFLLVRLNQDRAWIGRWIALGCVIVLALPTPFVLVDTLDPHIYDPTPMWSPFWRFTLAASKGLPMFVLWVVGAIQCYREGRAADLAAST